MPGVGRGVTPGAGTPPCRKNASSAAIPGLVNVSAIRMSPSSTSISTGRTSTLPLNLSVPHWNRKFSQALLNAALPPAAGHWMFGWRRE
jgi:hypothetical protein